MMLKLNRALPLLLLPVVLVGCSTTTITNLTPSRLDRKASGQYVFEVQYDTRQRSLIADSMEAYVVIGAEKYPMQRTPLLENRWETLVPIPIDQNVVNYQYRFDYEYRGIPDRKATSKGSNFYQLQIRDVP